MNGKRVTIKDIAKECGVSPNTVSHALRGLDDISEKTRKSVLDTAKRMNYVPNNAAAQLRGGVKKRIAVFYSYHHNAYYWNTLCHVQHELSTHGYEMMLLHSPYEADVEEVREVCSRMVEGVIGLGDITAAGAELVRAQHLAVSLIGKMSRYDFIDSVSDDNEGGAALATQRLLQRGYRKIVGMYKKNNNMRSEGYAYACNQANIVPRLFIISDDDFAKQTDAMLEKYPDADAVVCYNDVMAFGVCERLKELGRDDFGIIGYDAVQEVLGFPHKMASVGRDDAECARVAVKLLFERMNDFSRPAEKIISEMHLTEGFDCVGDA